MGLIRSKKKYEKKLITAFKTLIVALTNLIIFQEEIEDFKSKNSLIL